MYMSLASQLQRRCAAAQNMARSPCAPSQNQPHVLKAEVGDNFGQQRRAILFIIFHYDGILATAKTTVSLERIQNFVVRRRDMSLPTNGLRDCRVPPLSI